MSLQKLLCEQFGMKVTVCHYPPGASKCIPLKHRLFCEITKHWRGVPLTSFETPVKLYKNNKN